MHRKASEINKANYQKGTDDALELPISNLALGGEPNCCWLARLNFGKRECRRTSKISCPRVRACACACARVCVCDGNEAFK